MLLHWHWETATVYLLGLQRLEFRIVGIFASDFPGHIAG